MGGGLIDCSCFDPSTLLGRHAEAAAPPLQEGSLTIG
jgi:hypothetical protein